MTLSVRRLPGAASAALAVCLTAALLPVGATASSASTVETGTGVAVPTDDTFVELQAPNWAAGAADKLVASATSTMTKTTYLKVAVPQGPAGSTVTAVRLELTPVRTQAGQLRVHEVSQTAWNQATLTYAKAPAPGAVVAEVEVVGGAPVAVSLPTSLAGGTRALALTVPAGVQAFASAENGSLAGPRVVVEWQRIIPAAPVPTASVVGDDVVLTWPAVAGATAYAVHRNGQPLTSVTGTTATDPDRPAGSSAAYTVTATGPGGTSPASAPVVAALAPAAPVLTGTVQNADAVLHWTAPAGATSFTVTRDDGSEVYAGTATSVVDARRPAGSTTTYTVAAVGPGGTSAPSAAVALSVAPGAPVVTGEVSDGLAVLRWAAVPGATRYEVVRGDGTVVLDGPRTSATDPQPRPAGSTTTYAVTARGAGGSSRATHVALTAVPAAPVVQGTVEAGNDFRLTWTPVAGATGYVVTRANGSESAVDTTTFADLNRPLGSTAAYRVTAVNSAGSSPESAQVVLAAAPAVPVLHGAARSSTNELGWAAAAGATTYTLLRDGAVVASGAGLDHLDHGRVAGSTATYEVLATNGSGSTPSAPLVLTTASARTRFGTSQYVEEGETQATAWSRRVATYGQPGVARVFFGGTPGTWKFLTATYGTTPLNVSFKSDPRTVLSGANDAAYRTFFQNAPRDRPTWWTFFHEPEDDVRPGSWTTAEYRAAWAHIDRIADSVGNPQLKSALILMCWTVNPKSGRTWGSFYEASAVDVLAWDCYNAPSSTGSFVAPSALLDPAVAAARSVGKPWAVAEWGSTTQGTTGDRRAAWIRAMSQYMYDNDAVYGSYWDAIVPGSPDDFRLAGDPESTAALRTVITTQLP